MIEHALTHFDWRLHPRRLVLAVQREPMLGVAERQHGVWVPRADLPRYGLPAPLKRLLAV